MNFLTRMWRVLKANINAVIDKFEDPERMLERSIQDMQKQVQRVKADVITVVAAEKKLKTQVEKQEQEIGRWENNAMRALKEGNEKLAREALKRKQEAVTYVQQLRPQWEQQVQISERLKGEYHQLKERIETAQHKKRNLVVRLRHAETQKRLQGMLNELTGDRAFDRLERKISETEALAEAHLEVDDLSLERQFEKLGGGDLDVERELAALKERMKLNP